MEQTPTSATPLSLFQEAATLYFFCLGNGIEIGIPVCALLIEAGRSSVRQAPLFSEITENHLLKLLEQFPKEGSEDEIARSIRVLEEATLGNKKGELAFELLELQRTTPLESQEIADELAEKISRLLDSIPLQPESIDLQELITYLRRTEKGNYEASSSAIDFATGKLLT